MSTNFGGFHVLWPWPLTFRTENCSCRGEWLCQFWVFCVSLLSSHEPYGTDGRTDRRTSKTRNAAYRTAAYNGNKLGRTALTKISLPQSISSEPSLQSSLPLHRSISLIHCVWSAQRKYPDSHVRSSINTHARARAHAYNDVRQGGSGRLKPTLNIRNFFQHKIIVHRRVKLSCPSFCDYGG